MSETDRILNDIRTYLRIAAAAASKSDAARVIDTQEKAKIYEKLNGETSQQKIETETGIPHQTINRWSDEFVETGLASPPNEYCKNYKALFTLRELGINISELKKRRKKDLAEVQEKKPIGVEEPSKEETKD